MSASRALPRLRRISARAPPYVRATAFLAIFALAAHRGWGPTTRSTLIWATAAMASFVGWGTTLARHVGVDPRNRPDWGLRAAWGMAVVVAVGGCLLAAGKCSAPALRVIVGVGVLLGALEAWRPRQEDTAPPPLVPREPVFVAVAAVTYGLALFVCLGSLADRSVWYGFDDGPAYLVFPKQIVQAGELLQPFSIRRMVGYGGQPLLQAIVLGGSSMGYAHLFDHGLCTVVVLGMLLGLPRGRGASPVALRFLYAMVVIFMPNARMNVASVLSGTVFLYAIFRTLDLPEGAFVRRRGRGFVLGLLVAAASALRPSFILPAVGMVGLSYLWARRETRERRADVAEAVVCALSAALAILPWGIALYRSNHTFSFPPFDGGYDAKTGFLKYVLGRERFEQTLGQLRSVLPLGTIHLLFLAGLLMTDGTRRQSFRASFWALFLFGFLALIATIPIVDFMSLARYRLPAVVTLLLVVAGRAFGRECRRAEHAARNYGGAAAVLVACCIELAWQHKVSTGEFDDYFDVASAIMDGMSIGDPLSSPEREQLALKLQASVPEGEKMLVMLSDAYRLDFRRNPVMIVDVPGIVSPERKMPVLEGPEPLADYLLRRGIRYLAFVDTWKAQGLYDRVAWARNAIDDAKMPHDFIAPYVLGFFEDLDGLKKTRRHLFDGKDTVVLDLAARGS